MCLVQGTQCISFCQESSTIMIHKIIKAINFINKCSPQQHKDRSIIAICQAPGLVLKVFFLFLWILNVKHLDFLKTVVWLICRKIIISYNFILFFFFHFACKKTFKFLSFSFVNYFMYIISPWHLQDKGIYRLSWLLIAINGLNMAFPSAVTLPCINKTDCLLSRLDINTLMLLAAVFNILC